MTRLKRNLILVHLEIVLILTLDRCTVGTKRTIGLEITLMLPVELLGHMVHVKSLFGLFGDGVSVGVR
jgi:hypothetical protein